MENMITFQEYTKKIQTCRLPRFDELPDMELYADQVIQYLNPLLSVLQFDEHEDQITPSMINNYVRMKLLPPAHKKRYDRRHIAYLTAISIYKQLYSIDHIRSMILFQNEMFDILVSYDYFCTELENALHSTFRSDPAMPKDTTATNREERVFVRASCLAFSWQLKAEKYLQYKSR